MEIPRRRPAFQRGREIKPSHRTNTILRQGGINSRWQPMRPAKPHSFAFWDFDIEDTRAPPGSLQSRAAFPSAWSGLINGLCGSEGVAAFSSPHVSSGRDHTGAAAYRVDVCSVKRICKLAW